MVGQQGTDQGGSGVVVDLVAFDLIVVEPMMDGEKIGWVVNEDMVDIVAVKLMRNDGGIRRAVELVLGDMGGVVKVIC